MRQTIWLGMAILLVVGCAKRPAAPPPKTSTQKPVQKKVQGNTSKNAVPDLKQALLAYRKGVDFLNQDNLEAAKRAFEDAQKMAPAFALPYYGMGLVHLKRNQSKEAVVAFAKAVGVKPNFSQASLGLGIAYRQSGDLRAAEKAYLAGIKYDGSQPNLHYNLGILYEVYLGQPEEALKQYQVYLSLAQKNADERVKTWVSLLQKN